MLTWDEGLAKFAALLRNELLRDRHARMKPTTFGEGAWTGGNVRWCGR